jgi:ZIP family zinc transporter
MNLSNLAIAILLTVLAGLSTGIGGLIVLLFEKTNTKLLSVALGFSAGVMIYVSFVELLFESRRLLIANLGEATGIWVNVVAFFGGMLLIAIIDKLVPSYENPHEAHLLEEAASCPVDGSQKLLRTGIFTAVIIAIHNFPEGMATFVSSIQDPSLGLAIAIAVAIHNIPEGMSVAIPVFCATGSRKKALGWSLFSGMAEPVGAIAAYFILLPFLNDTVFGILFAGIAGIMVFISLDELLPTAREYGEHHLSIYGLIAGMMLMAFSLIVLM